jgi:hypothetical protein
MKEIEEFAVEVTKHLVQWFGAGHSPNVLVTARIWCDHKPLWQGVRPEDRVNYVPSLNETIKLDVEAVRLNVPHVDNAW